MCKIIKILSVMVLLGGASLSHSIAVEINNPYVKPLPPRMEIPSPQYRTGQPRQPYNPSPIQVPSQQRKSNGAADIKHIEWCDSQYRSYKRSDNSYVPLGGVQTRPCS